MRMNGMVLRDVRKACSKRGSVVGYSEEYQRRIRNGVEQLTGLSVIRIYVKAKTKFHWYSRNRREKVPSTIAGFLTDVVEIGDVGMLTGPSPSPTQGRLSSLLVGCSIGHKDVTAGTYARMVELGGEFFALSNNHVLANVNRGVQGDKVYQPGPFDVGQRGGELSLVYECGELAAFVRINPTGNLVDAALARLTKRSWFSRSPVTGGTLPGLTKIREAGAGDVCEKVGRTTGRTRLTVFDESFTGQVNMGDLGAVEFEDQILFTGTDGGSGIAGGDSGSLVYIQDGDEAYNVGLIFAGSTTVALANKMRHVVGAFSSPLGLDVPFFGEATEDDGGEGVLYEGCEIRQVILVDPKSPGRRKCLLRLTTLWDRATEGDGIEVAGELTDLETGVPLDARQIVIDGVGAVTDGQGAFSVTLVVPIFALTPEWTVVARFAGD